jgi:hypothetical protein
MKGLRLRKAAIGGISVLLVVAGVGSAILVHAASSPAPPAGAPADPTAVSPTAPTAAAASPSSCAGQPGTLLAALNVGSGFTAVGSASAVRPAGSSAAGQPAPVLYPQMTWFQAETLSNPATPISSPFDPTSMATTDRTEIFTVTDTVQSFTSAEAASTFLQGFVMTGQPSPEVPASSGQLMAVPYTVLIGFTAGDQTLVAEQSLPQTSIPTTVQVVVRVGDTVITVAATGGVDLSASQVEALATQQMGQLASACGSGY